jgi:predicted RNA-binding Zn ribbon-like protein
MVVNTDDQAAPADLERIRALLNTWLIPNDTRVATDRFRGNAVVRELRDDLRRVVEGTAPTDATLNTWVRRLDVTPQVADGVVRFRGNGSAGQLLAIVVAALADGAWARLRACPDCHWVFYDHTRNGSKRWCLMSAGGPDGRSCGSIAKVRAHRERERTHRERERTHRERERTHREGAGQST